MSGPVLKQSIDKPVQETGAEGCDEQVGRIWPLSDGEELEHFDAEAEQHGAEHRQRARSAGVGAPCQGGCHTQWRIGAGDEQQAAQGHRFAGVVVIVEGQKAQAIELFHRCPDRL